MEQQAGAVGVEAVVVVVVAAAAAVGVAAVVAADGGYYSYQSSRSRWEIVLSVHPEMFKLLESLY